MNEIADSRDLTSLEDEDLIRVATGETGPRARRASSELFGRYQRRIYVWCFRMVRDHDRALDLAQDAQLSAYRALGRFRYQSRFSSWLFAIVRNRCLADLRAVSLLRDEAAEIDTMVHPARGIDQELMEEESAQELLDLMEQVLEPQERQALALRCFEKVSVDEITTMLHLTNSTGARGLLQKARRKLRAALQERDREEGTHG